MNSLQKKYLILQELVNNYESLQSQSSIKIKTYHIFNNLDPEELLSDILYNFLEKLEDTTFIDRMYEIYLNKKLIAFLGKAIDIQARYTKAPFLQKKIKKFNETEFIEIYYNKTDEDNELNEEELAMNKEAYLSEEVNKVINQIGNQKLLGEYTFYYIRLFKDYIKESNTTYKDLSKKYNISLSTINRDMLYIKKCIIILLKERNIQFPINRKTKFSNI